MLVVGAKGFVSVRNDGECVELQNRQLGNGAANGEPQRVCREIAELQRDRAVETRVNEASRDVHKESTPRPGRFPFDTGNKMRGNTNHFCRPGQCELPRPEENRVRDLLIVVLSGQSDVADDITMQMQFNGRWLNGTG
mgnify:CR=1 FL=1